MKLFTKLRRVPVYGDMTLEQDGSMSAPLVATVIQGKLLGLFWIYIKLINA